MSEDMKREFDSVKGDMKAVRGDVDSLKNVVRRVAVTLSAFREEMRDSLKTVATKDDMRALKKSVEGLAGRVEDFRLYAARHEERISALEKRRA